MDLTPGNSGNPLGLTVSRRRVLQGTGITALAALVAACTPGSGSSASGSSVLPSSGAASASGGATLQEIDLLSVGMPSSIGNLYPGKEAGIVNFYIASLVGEGLVAPDGVGVLQPALAQSWKQTSPTTYVYTLRDGAVFQDGSPVTLDDVVFSIDLARDAEKSPGSSWAWGNMKSVKKSGANELTITLNDPNVAFEWTPCAANALWVTSEAYVKANNGEIGTPSALLMGTGPYKVTSFAPDSSVVLERVDTWWGGSVPVKTVRIDFIPEEATRLLARQSGDIDLAINISLDQAKAWEDTDSTTVYMAPNRSYTGIDFHTPTAPFDDIHVRKAIAYACNRQAYVERLLKGHGEVATALTTPEQVEGVFGAEGAREALAVVYDIPYDLEAAKAELAKSKVPNGFTATVGVSNSAPQVSSVFQVLKQDLEPLGIILEIKEMPVEQWYDTIGSSDWPLAYMDYTSTTGDPAEMSSWFLGEGNPAGYSNPEVTALMTQVNEESDPKKRAELLIAAQKLALEDIPYIPLWWGVAATALADTYEFEDFGSYTFVSPWTPRILTRA
jgi:peptide/nickel transport system substrate-binding protein